MNQPGSNPPDGSREIDDAIREAAARWIVRRDRGLSAMESIEFELWLADDERHVAAIRQSMSAWALLDRLPDNIGHSIAAKKRRPAAKRIWLSMGGLAAAAAVVATAYLFPWRSEPGADSNTKTAAVAVHTFTADGSARVMTLPDGTTVRMNAGSEIVEQFTESERRVHITRGEAHFTVTKNRKWPFVVRAGTVEVRALGTAFNVNLQSATVEVLVTEGSVQLNTSPENESAPPAGTNSDAASASTAGATAPAEKVHAPPPVVAAGQRALISLAPASADAAVVVSEVKRDEMAKVLAWQTPLLRLGGATLEELAAEFQRQTGQRIELGDPELAQRRIGGRFRADDVEGFVRLLEENYGVKSHRTADGVIVLQNSP